MLIVVGVRTWETLDGGGDYWWLTLQSSLLTQPQDSGLVCSGQPGQDQPAGQVLAETQRGDFRGGGNRSFYTGGSTS